ncbi:MAG: hypothetical protein HZC49_10310, partial [Nitrospirae bacterium]|nr:hypothetical protein [Nitrospirota bacterium]
NTSDTLTIQGPVDLSRVAAGNSFAIVYGKLIESTLATPNSGSKAVKFFNATGTNSFADGDAVYNGICEVCHTQTTHFRGSGAGPDQLHANINLAMGGAKCTMCHTHLEGFSIKGASGGGCISCHMLALGNRVSIMDQFNGNSHHIQGGAVTDAHCYQCHWEANSDGSINTSYHSGAAAPGSAVDLVIYGAGERPALYAPGATAVQYAANGARAELQKINSHCLGCHSDQNNGTQPFGDGKTPKQYAWDGTSVGSRYSQTGTTNWGKYSGPNMTPKDSVTKAYSAHGNATNNQGGWNLNETWSNTRNGPVNVACYDCHNSHGSNVSGVATNYTSATANGGILKDVTSGKGGYTATYKPATGGSAGDKNAYNPGAGLCFDCHLTSDAGAMPWGFSDTFGAAQKIMGYWDTEYFGPGTFGPQSRYPYKSATTNKGGHFGRSSDLNSPPDSSHQINGLCTPCHDPHGVSTTLGANQQYAVPLLKGTWLTAPYKEDAAPANNTTSTIDDVNAGNVYHIDQNTFGTHVMDTVAGVTQTDAQFAGLCLNCHQKAGLTDGANGGIWKSRDRIHESVKGWGVNTKHKYTCSKCHIPHNSRLPRLMATNCLNKNHKGRVGYTAVPTVSGSGYDCYTELIGDERDCGGGGGGLPGSWSGDAYGSYSVSCHEGRTGSAADQSWNNVTSWAVTTPPSSPALTDEPNAFSSGGNINITLQWNAVACPDGDATRYYVDVIKDGSAYTNSGWIAANTWTVSLPLGNYSWKVKARDAVHTSSESGYSASDAFSIIYAAPSAPILTDEGNYTTTGGNRNVQFDWSTVAMSDGDSAQYYVNVIKDGSAYANSGWLGVNTWSVSLPTGNYTWEVKSRDSVHTSAESVYSGDTFSITYAAPSAPVLIDELGTTGTGPVNITLNWNSVVMSDGDAPQYQVDVDTDNGFAAPFTASSGWLPVNQTNWAVELAPGATYYWRVTARDSVHTAAISGPSASDSFSITYGTFTTYTFTFNYTGAIQYLTIPSGAINIQFSIKGAGGGGGRLDNMANQEDGQNGHLVNLSDSTSGVTLSVYVGGGGQAGPVAVGGGSGGWGYNPGGTGGAGEDYGECYYTGIGDWSYGGAGGGGASAVLSGGTMLVKSAGGSGGRSSDWSSECNYVIGGSGGAGGGSDYPVTTSPTGGGAGGVGGETPYSGGNGQVVITYMIDSSVTAPTLVDEPDANSSGGNINVALQWNAVTIPDGDTAQYLVEVSSSSGFSPVSYSSAWQTGTNWTVSLPIGAWHWRVTARDSVHTGTVSSPSVSDSFNIIYVAPQTFTFNYTGAIQYINIPAGAANIQFTVKGAGGGGGREDGEHNQENGWNGHSVVMSYSASGITLRIYVGGGGTEGSTEASGSGGGWGYHSGGSGGNGEDHRPDTDDWAYGGAGGGGSSALLLDSNGAVLMEAAGGAGGRSSDWDGSGGCDPGYCENYAVGGAGGIGGGSDFPSTTSSTGGGAGGVGGGGPGPGGNGQVVITYEY